MTSEEKAIDYATTECCHSCTSSCDKNKCNMFCNVRNAVLYGLAEGKPKWHDLREEPSDLPEEGGEYWTKWEDGTYSTGHYFQDNGFGDYVIAWCELPKFEEK